MVSVPDTLGERVKRVRTALGHTQLDIAKPDLSKSFVSLLERDLTRPSVSTLERIAQRLRKPISYFIWDIESELSQRVLNVLNSRGRSELIRQRYDAALAAFSEMCTLAAARRDAKMEMDALVGQGEALAGLWRLQEAKKYLTDALGRAREAVDALVECRAVAGLARVAHRSGDFPHAAALYETALTIVGMLTGEMVLHGEIVFYRGMVLYRMGRLEEAEEAFTQAQQIFEDTALPERIGAVLVSHGPILYLKGDYDGALILLERARVLLEQHEDLATLSWARNNLGWVLLEIGRPREALEHFSVSLAIKRRLKDSFHESHTLTEIARCYFACGELAPAREYAEQAIALSRNGGAPDEEPRAQIVLASVAIAEGDTRAAQRYLLLAVEHCERTSMTLELVTIYRGLAYVTTLHGRHKEASAYHEKAFAVLRSMTSYDAVAAIRAADSVAQAHRRIAAPASFLRSQKERSGS